MFVGTYVNYSESSSITFHQAKIMFRFIVSVADILLWRDEKTSFACFVVMVLLFYWFFLSGSTFISSTAGLLLLVTLLLFGYGILPSKL